MENLRKISSSSMYGDTINCSQESIVSAIDRFITSVNRMSSAVMVPSKLHDLEDNQDTRSVSSASSDDGSYISSNLYDTYKMLVRAKDDIVWGPSETKEIANDNVGQQFRHHLQQLQIMLHQFSDLSEYLSLRYKTDSGLDD
ncbi:Mid1-interacting protein-like protein [Leptotrombidium deliense]|uniref:Mid1-interacting protein-like protein n=1 Tax=Leptotrombidium deliense TaxID=299467 RepID=A0A443SAS4_9ACAR|nr:Mid1-interacting protein-like protein [Leptotrombidium deliense]